MITKVHDLKQNMICREENFGKINELEKNMVLKAELDGLFCYEMTKLQQFVADSVKQIRNEFNYVLSLKADSNWIRSQLDLKATKDDFFEIAKRINLTDHIKIYDEKLSKFGEQFTILLDLKPDRADLKYYVKEIEFENLKRKVDDIEASNKDIISHMEVIPDKCLNKKYKLQ